MKKSLQLIFTVIIALSTLTTYGQIWNAPDANGNVTTNTTVAPVVKNVVVGPMPTTPTQLYLNNASPSSTLSSSTTLTIDNSYKDASGPTSNYSYLNFNLQGINYYKMFYSQFPAMGTGLFHIMPANNNAPGIHMSTDQITFCNKGYGRSTGDLYGDGKYLFDGIIGTTTGINIGYNNLGGFNAPTGYKFTNSGMSYFKDKVLIGTTSTAIPTSSYKLYVGGTAICEELIVKLQASWPDFVFSPQYKLKPLSEVKTYITKYSHLPDVPAACEIEEKGIATSEMLTIQMKKIEELTLYMIQMEERIKELEAQNKTLQK